MTRHDSHPQAVSGGDDRSTVTDAPPAQRLALGVIADDVTGASDVATALRNAGLPTALFFGTPQDTVAPRSIFGQTTGSAAPGVEAAVIALKTRNLPAAEAVARSREALRWLSHRAERIYIKYCSTFDSTADGNIGPVIDAVMEDLHVPHAVHTPSSPVHGRTQYMGHLFVFDQLLSESSMRNHPLTPMRDSSLTRLLRPQTPHSITVMSRGVTRQGSSSIRSFLESHSGHIMPDAIDDADMDILGEALSEVRLTGGGAGLAGAIARHVAAISGDAASPPWSSVAAPAIALAGSCSERTREQITAHVESGAPHYRLDLARTLDPASLAHSALDWLDRVRPGTVLPLISSCGAPDELRAIQQQHGVQRSAEVVEDTMRRIAVGARERGYLTFILAGGETSGAVIDALQIAGVAVGADVAPGVPWLHTPDGVHALLKSGNFGDPDFFVAVAHAVGGPS